MASLLTTSDRISFTTSINDHFDTFKRTITIFIEPKNNFNNATPQNFLPGYQSASTAKPAYTIQSANHDAIVNYDDFDKTVALSTGKNTNSGKIKIKVKQATRDYIVNNKVVKIMVDGDTFNVASEGRRANFLNKNLGSTYGEIFYIFELEYTK